MSERGNVVVRLRELITTSRLEGLIARVTSRWGAPLDEAAHAIMLGRYELDRVLGRGTHGVVIAGYDRGLERDVALKLFWSGSEEALLHEARALARLSHPNVVAIHDVSHVDGLGFLVMALIDGGTMSQRMRIGLDWRTAVELFARVGHALAYAHRLGFVHGDVKPGNVLVGDDGRVYLADFGHARLTGWRERGESAPAGTRSYVAPEVWAGAEIDARSDQFSFCVGLWEALFGGRPWGSSFELLCGEAQPAKPRAVVVPPRLEQVVRRGLAPRPGDRYPSVDALLDDLCVVAAPGQGQRRAS